MGTRIKTNPFLKVSKIFSDETLTHKATLNAIASVTDYAARLLVAFTITPITVSILGDYLFGIWQILNRFISFISPTSGRPSTVLRYTLAHHQSVADNHEKRTFIGSAVAVWLIFLPFVVVAGAVLTWFIPYWLHAPQEHVWKIRLTAAILAADLAATGIGAIPQAVMQGQNIGYKRLGLTVFMIILGGGLTWLALAMGFGIAGVATATLISTILTGLLFLKVMKTYTPWFGINHPSQEDIYSYLGLSWWFIIWDIIFKIMISIDVIILGLLNSVESVASYTLTKYAPEMLITVIAMVVFGVAPGLGGIIGAKEFERAARIRGEIWTITWFIIAVLGTTIMIWNREFLTLWVGPDKYTGTLPMLLIFVVVAQFVMIRVDANFIDLTLQIQRKVVFGLLSVGLTIVISVMLVQFFQSGFVGVLTGMIVGRLILSFGYPIIVGKFLNMSPLSQIKTLGRPAIVTVLVLACALYIDSSRWIQLPSGFKGWILLFLLAGITTICMALMIFYAGLSKSQRSRLLKRAQSIIPTPS